MKNQFYKLFDYDKGQLLITKEEEDEEYAIILKTKVDHNLVELEAKATLSFKNKEDRDKAFDKNDKENSEVLFKSLHEQLIEVLDDINSEMDKEEE